MMFFHFYVTPAQVGSAVDSFLISWLFCVRFSNSPTAINNVINSPSPKLVTLSELFAELEYEIARDICLGSRVSVFKRLRNLETLDLEL